MKKKIAKETAITTGIIAGGATAVKGALTYFGFSSAGPIAGSTAAAMQAGIGNVVAGSAFATAQSLQ